MGKRRQSDGAGLGRCRVWLAGLGLLGLLAGPALAGEPAPVRLLVLDTLDLGAGADRAAWAGTQLQHALEELGRFEVRRPAEVLAEHAGASLEVQQEIARARGYLGKGRENLLNLALEEAAESFQSARVALRRQLAWLDEPDLLLAALMGLAEALSASGDEISARAAYLEVQSLSPGYEPDPGQLPSRLRAVFDEVREQAAQQLRGSLTVESQPAGAEVTVDGLRAGLTPLVKGELPPGLHAVVVRHDGFRRVSQVVEVTPGQAVQLDLVLPPEAIPTLEAELRRALTAPEADPAAQRRLATELAAACDAAALVASALHAPSEGDSPVLVGAVFGPSAATGPTVAGARLPPGEAGEAVVRMLAFGLGDAVDGSRVERPAPDDLELDFTSCLLGRARAQAPPTIVRVPQVTHRKVTATELPPPPPVVSPAPAPREEPTPLWGRWWFWTGVGVLVAGGVATALALTLGPEVQTIYEPDVIHVQVIRNP